MRESITIDISEDPSQIPMPVPPKDAEIKREVSDPDKERIVVEELSEKKVHAVITDGYNRVRFLRSTSTLLARSKFP